MSKSNQNRFSYERKGRQEKIKGAAKDVIKFYIIKYSFRLLIFSGLLLLTYFANEEGIFRIICNAFKLL
jgi:hypothetical protein